MMAHSWMNWLPVTVGAAMLLVLGCARTPISGHRSSGDAEGPSTIHGDSDVGALGDSVPTSCLESQCDSNAACKPHASGGERCACDMGFVGTGTICNAVVSTLAAGGAHTCSIRDDHTLWCWGFNVAGSVGDGTTLTRPAPVQAGNDSDWQQLNSPAPQGIHANCATRIDGSVWCWGGIGLGYGHAPTKNGSQTEWESVSSGDFGIFGVKTDGTLWRWENATDLPIKIDTNTSWLSVSSSSHHACALRDDASLWCWGANEVGQLGLGASEVGTPQSDPAHVGASSWQQVMAGTRYTCGIQLDGSLWCWGTSAFGVLGTASGDSPQPARVGLGANWAHVAVRASHTCAVERDGKLWCWGYDEFGAVGHGPRKEGDPLVWQNPVEVSGGALWSFVSLGDQHSCAQRLDGTLWCWGWNREGRLGIGTVANKEAPSQVGTDTDWLVSDVSLPGGKGPAHACGLKSDGSIACWGRDASGQFGDGSTESSTAPRALSLSGVWQKISVGGWGLCAIRDDSTLWCNDASPGGASAALAQMGSGTNWNSVEMADDHACGLRDDNTLWCWGASEGGKLGVLPLEDALVPAQVGTAVDWMALATGEEHSCGIRGDGTQGTLWCWGGNAQQQVNAEGPDRHTPAQVEGDSDWASVHCGVVSTCGIRVDGTLWCWGGDVGAAAFSFTPTQIGSGTDWDDVDFGYQHLCGLRSTGQLWCWGRNFHGAAGMSPTVFSLPDPVRIGSGSTWSSIGAGVYASCATQDDGTLWCWGNNQAGELGTGDAWKDEPTNISF